MMHLDQSQHDLCKHTLNSVRKCKSINIDQPDIAYIDGMTGSKIDKNDFSLQQLVSIGRL